MIDENTNVLNVTKMPKIIRNAIISKEKKDQDQDQD